MAPAGSLWHLAARYTGIASVGHLLWEIAQLPLYTIWQIGTTRQNTVAVLHCTGGDILIAAVTLAFACGLARFCRWPLFGLRMICTAITLGLAYTIFSEWMNVTVWRNWAYAEAMPVLPPLGTGLAPLLQWLVVPVLAYLVACNQREQIKNMHPFSRGWFLC